MIAPAEVSSSPALRGARLPSNERGRPAEGVRLPPNNLRQKPLERLVSMLPPVLFFCRVVYAEKFLRRHKGTKVQEQEEEHEYYDG